MAKAVIGAEIKVDSRQAEQSVGNIRSRIKEARNELINAIENFGEFSAEAVNAAKKVEQLKGTMDDASRLVSNFDGDRKFQAFGQAVSTVAGGFAAAQGAMALFGVESKEVEQALLKVQAAMALSQGINGVLEGIKSFKDLGNIIKSTTIFQNINNAATVAATTIQKLFGASVIGTGTAFNILKTAIIATGIGALIVLIGTLISSMDRFTKSTESAADAQSRLRDETEKANKAFSDQESFFDRETELRIKRAKAAGASESQITAITRQGIQDRIVLLNKELDERIKRVGSDQSEIRKKLDEAIRKQQDFELDQQIKATEKSQAAAEAAAEKAAAAAKARREKELAAYKKYQEDKKAFDESLGTGEKITEDSIEAEGEMLRAQEQSRLDIEKEFSNARITAREEEAAYKKSISDREKAEEEAAAEFRKKQIQEVSDMLGNAIKIVGEQTAVGKALSIAKALMNTYQGATEVLASESTLPEPAATISRILSVGAVIATGLKSVKEIMKVKVPGAGGGGSVSVPSVSAPIRPQLSTTTLNQDQINQVGNAAARAYVLESEISDSQQRIRRINRAARLR
jgi:hypothetical protein